MNCGYLYHAFRICVIIFYYIRKEQFSKYFNLNFKKSGRRFTGQGLCFIQHCSHGAGNIVAMGLAHGRWPVNVYCQMNERRARLI
jgi:hypothetical protein